MKICSLSLLWTFIILQGSHLLAQPILGTFNRVPNGSFEALAVTPTVGGGSSTIRIGTWATLDT
jgi:hypothetical protein